MIIFYRTRKLEKICNKKDAMKKSLGEKMSKKLQQRLAELKAANTLADISYLPPVRLHELIGTRQGQFSVDLEHPFRLLFIVANQESNYLESGSINRQQVTEIEIIAITDTH